MNILKMKRFLAEKNRDEIAKKLGVTSSMISQYENDKRFPNSKDIINIMNAYDLTTDELIEYLLHINKLSNKEI